MKNSVRLFVAVLALLIAFINSDAFANENKPVHPYLYRVKVNGHTSWLIGTMHTPYVKIEDFHPSLKDAVRNADLVLAEGVSGRNLSLNQVLKKYQMPSQKPLRLLLSTGAWSRLQSWVKAIYQKEYHKNILEALNTTDPGVVLLTVKTVAEGTRATESGMAPQEIGSVVGETGAQIFDEQLYELVSREKKRLRYLDPDDYLYRAYSSQTPIAALNDYLMLHIDRNGKIISDESLGLPSAQVRAKNYQKSSNEYARGTLDLSIRPLEFKGLSPFWQVVQTVEGEITPRRHIDWLPNILEAMRRGPVAVIAGVRHVADPGNGLIRLLARQEDVEVTPAIEIFSANGDNCQDALK